MTKEKQLFKLSNVRGEFNAWHEALINAEVVPVKEFEKRSIL